MSPESWDASVDVYCAVADEVVTALVNALAPVLELRLSDHDGHGYGTHLLAIVNLYHAMGERMRSMVDLCEPVRSEFRALDLSAAPLARFTARACVPAGGRATQPVEPAAGDSRADGEHDHCEFER